MIATRLPPPHPGRKLDRLHRQPEPRHVRRKHRQRLARRRLAPRAARLRRPVTLISARGARTLALPRLPPQLQEDPSSRPTSSSSASTVERRFSGYRSYIRKVGTRNAQAISKVALACLASIAEGDPSPHKRHPHRRRLAPRNPHPLHRRGAGPPQPTHSPPCHHRSRPGSPRHRSPTHRRHPLHRQISRRRSRKPPGRVPPLPPPIAVNPPSQPPISLKNAKSELSPKLPVSNQFRAQSPEFRTHRPGFPHLPPSFSLKSYFRVADAKMFHVKHLGRAHRNRRFAASRSTAVSTSSSPPANSTVAASRSKSRAPASPRNCISAGNAAAGKYAGTPRRPAYADAVTSPVAISFRR